MTLKNWLKNMDLVFEVSIWGEDNEKPLYEGTAFNIPWTIINYPIGKTNDEKGEPIHIYAYRNECGANIPKVIINVIENNKNIWF